MVYNIALIPGDGIGPEVMQEGVKILNYIASEDSDVNFELIEFPWGCEYYLRNGKMMGEKGIKELANFDAILLGAVGFPGVPDYISLGELLLKIRKGFDEYANVRPIRLLKGVNCPIKGKTSDDIDMLFIRENSEGEYSESGTWLYKKKPNEVVIQNSVFSRVGCERIIRYAFEIAKKMNKSLTSISKGNALNYSMVFWDQIFNEISKEYPNVKTQSYLVDAASMLMVTHPERFEIIVTSNLFGDILTDLGAAIVGGMGLVAGANINPERKYPSMFEPIHGSAPDIAGKGIANPIAMMLSVGQMLTHLGFPLWENELIEAVDTVIKNGDFLTPDLGGQATTSQVGDSILKNLKMSHTRKKISV